MKITLASGKELYISFEYVYREFSDKREMLGTKAVLEILDPSGENRTYNGYAVVKPNEAPRRIVGRKIALRYALKEAGFLKPEKSEIWLRLVERGMRLHEEIGVTLLKDQLLVILRPLSTAYERLNKIDSYENSLVVEEKEEVNKALDLVSKLLKEVS